ncbi:transcriptional corepressor ssn6 [Fusarium sporotrichioides]|uniref:Transcriptional corepressor ssn6 n=1 Tax=Fusarium sporotrichioides TaxID=5514 RepID=A0A395S228_FUSSP|nr:transcriptional corepressor ssn6 [Fusarium sporotrichioides]
MSFGYAVGDVIAVLGLFERIAIELRNYKDAPMHFQQLRAELDLVHSTLKHVLTLEPNCKEEFQTLEQIRAIVIHCSQPLQAMVNKMRSKESSLGHFRSTRCLSGIGERLHWSMIAQGDIDSVRKTIMSQMAAINILLSVQQLTRVKHLSFHSNRIGADQSLIIEKHADAIAGHASNILKIASRTQETVTTLTVNAAIQADIHSKQRNEINQRLTGIETNMVQLAQKTERASAMLKHIMKAIEAIPLHLTLDIVRLDDAHGESWALPLQACHTWESFCDLLRCVVYANERPGANYILQRLFTVTHAKTGRQVEEDTWASTTCGRWVTAIRAPSQLVVLYQEDSAITAFADTSAFSRNLRTKVGPQLPSIDAKDKPESFRRVKVVYPTEPVRDVQDALARSREDPIRPEPHAFIGFATLRAAEYGRGTSYAQNSIYCLEIAIKSDSSNAEYWYLMGRAYMLLGNYGESHECFQEAVYVQHRFPTFWISIGILYFKINQYRDSLDAFARAIRLNAYTYEAWYNLGVLYDSYTNQHDDSTNAFRRCEELKPGSREVVARLKAYRAYVQDSNEELFRNHLIHEMIETGLQTHYERANEAQGEDISFNPVRDPWLQRIWGW